MKIFICLVGDYSSAHPGAAFSKREAADLFNERFGSGEIAEIEVDSIDPSILPQAPLVPWALQVCLYFDRKRPGEASAHLLFDPKDFPTEIDTPWQNGPVYGQDGTGGWTHRFFYRRLWRKEYEVAHAIARAKLEKERGELPGGAYIGSRK